MFSKKKDNGDGNAADNDAAIKDGAAPPLKPFSKKGNHGPSKPPTAPSFQPEVPRRIPDIPGAPVRRTERTLGSESDDRRLVVGRDIRLTGEITACDKLVVEGHVEITLPGAGVIEIAPSGFFKGKAEVQEADISGRFEGDLIAKDRLIVRAGGRISGTIRYGNIVIESGGEISGDMQSIDAAEQSD
jgi:cytoskeletal protein CcmA (bactofilin family)